MQQITSQLMTDFHCVGGTCPLTCCAGWQINIDEPAWQRYRNLPGKLGSSICSKIHVKDGKPHFALTKDNRCPFLNSDGLCDIIIATDESYLSRTCTNYPRKYSVFGSFEFLFPEVSCPEVLRLLFETESPLQPVIRTGEAVLPLQKAISEQSPAFQGFFTCFQYGLHLAQRPDIPFRERYVLLIYLLHEMMDFLKTNSFSGISRSLNSLETPEGRDSILQPILDRTADQTEFLRSLNRTYHAAFEEVRGQRSSTRELQEKILALGNYNFSEMELDISPEDYETMELILARLMANFWFKYIPQLPGHKSPDSVAYCVVLPMITIYQLMLYQIAETGTLDYQTVILDIANYSRFFEHNRNLEGMADSFAEIRGFASLFFLENLFAGL